MKMSATISPCGRYRYLLHREWESGKPQIVWAMLNPSTADAEKDDPTIRRCIDFSRRWGYGGLWVVNLFAIRTTDPKYIYNENDPAGERNRDAWMEALNEARMKSINWVGLAEKVICAWGMHGKFMMQDETAMGWIEDMGMAAYCLGKTQDGSPRHPLYLKKDTELIPYLGRMK